MNNYFGQLGIDKCLTFKGHIRFLSGPARTFSSRWHIRKERYLMHAKATVTKKGKKLCKPCCKIKPLVNCKRCARARHKTRFRVNVGVILVIFQVRSDLKKRPKDINQGERTHVFCMSSPLIKDILSGLPLHQDEVWDASRWLQRHYPYVK